MNIDHLTETEREHFEKPSYQLHIVSLYTLLIEYIAANPERIRIRQAFDEISSTTEFGEFPEPLKGCYNAFFIRQLMIEMWDASAMDKLMDMRNETLGIKEVAKDE